MEKRDIKNHTLPELEGILTAMGQPKYRARQIFRWLFKAGVNDFALMRNISTTLRGRLGSEFFILRPDCVEKNTSIDGTIKLLFGLGDMHYIETVVIPSKARNTICLSTQAGCRFKCAFCASGMKGFLRNLSVSEILNQILYVKDTLKIDISNYVFMGMGEPLDNYDNFSNALNIMNDENALNIGARRITISTCDIAPGIRKLGSLNIQVNLSLSLHAATDTKRTRLMPVNRCFSLASVIGALSYYLEKTGRIITLEYILMPGINDTLSDACELAKIARFLKAKINLIPYSKIHGLNFKPPANKDMESFLRIVKSRHEYITLRHSKGDDVQAACGQLALRK